LTIRSKNLGNSKYVWWRTQSKSNPSPLPNSLLTGKRTGNFAKTAVSVASKTVNNSVVTGLPKQIPYSTEQGIILPEQGMLAQEQGIFSAGIEIVAERDFRHNKDVDSLFYLVFAERHH
jgi:hypothetical protein